MIRSFKQSIGKRFSKKEYRKLSGASVFDLLECGGACSIKTLWGYLEDGAKISLSRENKSWK